MSVNYEITGISYCEHNSDYLFMTEILYALGFVINEAGKTREDELR